MKDYFLSLGIGLLVGVLYSLCGVRSPAPPAIALLGLMGMLLGEHALTLAKQRFYGAPIATEIRGSTSSMGSMPGSVPKRTDPENGTKP